MVIFRISPLPDVFLSLEERYVSLSPPKLLVVIPMTSCRSAPY